MRFIPLLLSLFILSNSYSQTLLSYKKVHHFDEHELDHLWKKHSVPKVITPRVCEVDLYDVMYKTHLPNGEEVVASGLYYVPLDYPYEIATMQYNHGTSMKSRKDEGDWDYNGESTICKIFAADGYAVAWQDYIGLGRGKGFHPYQHLETEGQSGVDLLLACKQINKEIGLKVNNQLFITGYSQGGHSTMAVHKMIEENYSNEFTVTASSSMSGAHDMSGVQREIMQVDYPQPHYLPYLLYGYQKLYKLLPNEEAFYSIFKPKYRHVLDKIKKKEHGVDDINAMLPSSPFTMIEDSFFNLFLTDSSFLFTKVLMENNTYNWKPKAPIQFCYCEGDEEVYYKNSIVAMEHLRKNGAKKIVDRKVGKVFNHRHCAPYAIMYTKIFFDSFRNGYDRGTKGNVVKNMMIRMASKMEEKKITKRNNEHIKDMQQ